MALPSRIYRYLQIRHYFDKNIKGYTPGNVSGITQMFIRAYNAKNYPERSYSELYKYIVELRGHSTNHIKVKWERELGIVIAPEEWTNIIKTQITTTASQLWMDFSWRNCVRFCTTPKQKSRQTGSQPTCWRGCGH